VLGVKAPSLYRYFPDKEALEAAVAEEILNLMLCEFRAASETADAETRFRRLTDVYLRFARERSSALRVRRTEPPSPQVRLKSGQGRLEPADRGREWCVRTAGRHRRCCRYLVLLCMATPPLSSPVRSELPGPRRGVETFLSNFRTRADHVGKGHSTRATGVPRRKKP
jgi:AcrR family transcriptional regulator